jgi:MoaA/NifB/PqqE/SkfB family radical SAM enzyme
MVASRRINVAEQFAQGLAPMRVYDFLHSWGKILRGKTPVLSIEITRECPLSCPGCYAYGESHLGGETRLRDLVDFRGDELVDGILNLADRHDPVHVSLVGGEPMMRHRELSRVLPALNARGVLTMVVTSGVIPIPAEWSSLPMVTIAVSVDGLPREHDERRKPATYERILRNIDGRKVNVHCTVVRQHLARDGYLDDFLAFWSARPEVNRIWFSVYTPQRGEKSPERLRSEDRMRFAALADELSRRHPKLMLPQGMSQAVVRPPESPQDCIFARMSANYTADLHTRVEPCVFGGDPDCSECGCSISTALHWIGGRKVAGVRVRSLVRGSMAIGRAVSHLNGGAAKPERWMHAPTGLVQIKRSGRP